MKPLVAVAPGTRVVLGIGFFVLLVAVRAAATIGGLVSKTFLADPLTMVRSGWTLLTEMGFAHDIGMTVWCVLGGFVVAAALALPLGAASRWGRRVGAGERRSSSKARTVPERYRCALSQVKTARGAAATRYRTCGALERRDTATRVAGHGCRLDPVQGRRPAPALTRGLSASFTFRRAR
jgi:hypothetical protein